ncbi:glycosyltransferase family 2 protein [soil metagenome]
MYDRFDDLRVVSNDLSDAPGLTVTGLVRNEMYFLPAFLAHYRRLGAERFILLNDRSDDGTAEFLARQGDVMVVESGHRYGDEVVPDDGPDAGTAFRMIHIWKTLLLRKYCAGSWAFSVDADEFVVLPPGMSVRDLARTAGRRPERALFGLMIDVYPERIDDLREDRPFDPESGWYFDGVAHYRADGERLAQMYSGSRARLFAQYGLRRMSLKNRIRNCVWRPNYPNANLINKPIFLNWTEDDIFHNSHRTTLSVNPTIILPIKHFKFVPDLYRRAATAVREGQYYQKSEGYLSLSEVLRRMEMNGGSFRCGMSKPAKGYSAFASTQNAMIPGT